MKKRVADFNQDLTQKIGDKRLGRNIDKSFMENYVLNEVMKSGYENEASNLQSQDVLRGLLLDEKECPFRLLDQIKRFESKLEENDFSVFKQILQEASSEIYGAVSYLKAFFGKDVLQELAPICMTVAEFLA